MKNIFKSILIIALILIALSLMFGNSQNLNFISKVNPVSISELVTMINNGKIQEIEIKDNNIVSIDVEKNKMTTKINANESIFDVLKYYNVEPTKLETTKIVFKEDVN
jgi:hypothetical protein